MPLRNPDEVRSFNAQGLPLCAAGLAMPLKATYIDRTHLIHHQRGRYACPLHFPQATGQTCPIADPHWRNGGCLTTMSTSIGARLRHQIDRKSQAFKQLYRQRTATERIFSQAFELGIERPKLRNGRSIANLNTLIYITINLRTYQRLRHT
ncbi:MAG: transposase [Caldilineaceae bacterium]